MDVYGEAGVARQRHPAFVRAGSVTGSGLGEISEFSEKLLKSRNRRTVAPAKGMLHLDSN